MAKVDHQPPTLHYHHHRQFDQISPSDYPQSKHVTKKNQKKIASTPIKPEKHKQA